MASMLPRLLFALAALSAPHLYAGEAGSASCNARIERLEVRAGSGYLPLAGSETALPVEIELSATAGCRLVLAFRSEAGGRLAGAEGALEFQLRDDAGRVLAVDGGTRMPVAPGVDRLVTTLVFAPGQPVQAGRYRDRLAVQLFDNDRAVDERELVLAVPVQSQATVSLAGSAAAGFSRSFGGGLDFGELRENKEREALLFVLANAAYALRLESANRGRLRHISGEDTIGYLASLDGRALDLSGEVLVEGRGRGRWLTWTPYRLSVRIGDVDGRAAGVYRDVITVDVVLLE